MDEHDPSFGRWLQQRRMQLGFTQESLGKQVGLSADMIRKIESEVRRPSPDAVTLLAQTLNVPDAESKAFLRFARGESRRPPEIESIEQIAPWRDAATAAHPLPRSLTPLIGREQAITQIATLVQQPAVRLVTLLGPGGIGKTRLAIAVAEASRAAFSAGTTFVNLAPVSDPTLVLATIAQALDITEQGDQPLLAHVLNLVRDRHMLLVLDNFEQVVAAGLVVADLLQGTKYLTVLVTSRAPLQLRGEREIIVNPLEVPGPPPPPLDVLSQYAAVRLFISRAQNVNADFEVTTANAPAIAEICARLDGLPLAIELAAARIKILSPEALLHRLDHRLQVLTGGARDLPARQQTLRSTIEWSYSLLEPPEQRFFARLALFIGGWTLATAEAICTTEEGIQIDVLNSLQSLINNSLVQRVLVSHDGETLHSDTDDDPRFGMLETIHEYAHECLRATDDKERFEQRFASYFLDLLERDEPGLFYWPQGMWLDWVQAEYGNLRAALQGAIERTDITLALRLVGALASYWYVRGPMTEGRRWLDAALALPGGTSAARAKALSGAGTLAWMQADVVVAEQYHEQARAHYAELGDHIGVAFALNNVAVQQLQDNVHRALEILEASYDIVKRHDHQQGLLFIYNNFGCFYEDLSDFDSARHWYNVHLSQARLLNEPFAIATALENLANLASLEQDYATARPLIEESLRQLRLVGYTKDVAIALLSAANIAIGLGDFRATDAYIRESLAIGQDLASDLIIADSLVGFALLASAEHQMQRMVRLAAAAMSARQTVGIPLPPIRQQLLDDKLAQARDMIGERASTALWAEGAAMSVNEARVYALAELRD